VGGDGHGADVEARLELAHPLLHEVRRAQHGERLDVAAVEQLAGDERGLDGLADADVVGDEQAHGIELERHQQRDELVGAGLDGDLPEAAERARRRAGATGAGVAQEQSQRRARRAGVRRPREGRLGDGLGLEREVD
jgi:hypothetical protein